MKRIITISALLILVFSTSFAQPMKWKKLADRVVEVHDDGYGPIYSAIKTYGNIILAGWQTLVLSTDRGKTWTTLPTNRRYDQIMSIDIYDENTFAVSSKAGLLYSSDQGRTWVVLSTDQIHYVIFDNSPDKMICIDNYRTILLINSDKTFKGVQIENTVLDIQRGADGAYYTKGGNVPDYANTLFRSADNGNTWQVVSNIIQPDYDCYSFICDKTDPRRFVIVNEDWAVQTDYKSQIFVTSDAGATWTTTLEKPLGNNTYLMGNAAQGCNDYFVGTSSDGILRSNDKGMTWHSVGGPRTPVDSRSIFAVDDSIVYVIDDLGSIWVTDAAKQGTMNYTARTPATIQTDTIGGDIVIPISITHFDSTIGGFVLHFDPHYLIYHGTFHPSGADHTMRMDDSTVWIGYNPSTDSALYAKFSFFPIDSNCTDVRIDSITPAGTNTGCYGSKSSISVCAPEGCGYRELSRFIRYGTAPEFTITPNPTRGTITLQSNMDIDGANIEIRNEVGAINYSMRSDIRKADGLSLDVSSLPSGAYILLVKGHGAGVPLIIMK